MFNANIGYKLHYGALAYIHVSCMYDYYHYIFDCILKARTIDKHFLIKTKKSLFIIVRGHLQLSIKNETFVNTIATKIGLKVDSAKISLRIENQKHSSTQTPQKTSGTKAHRSAHIIVFSIYFHCLFK